MTATTTDEMRERALALAAKGFRVFRLREGGKIPLPGVSWVGEATSDPDAIDWLWSEPYNIGIACGRGLMVVDIDVKGDKAGDTRWRDLVASHGAVDTLTVDTPSGGQHLYFSADDSAEIGNSVSRVAPGIDVRCDEGYVVAPGSVTASGRYAVSLDAPVEAAPEWLKVRARKHVSAAATEAQGDVKADQADALHSAIAWLYGSAPLAVEGDAGDLTTFRVAAKLKDMGVSGKRAYELMSNHWNPRCSPPWYETDLMLKVKNAYSYSANSFGADTAEAQLGDVPGMDPDSAPQPKDARPPLSVSVAPAADAKPQARPWLIRGLAMLGQVTLVVAPGGAGKSTVTFAAMNAVARVDGRFIGREVVAKRCGAVWMMNNEDALNELHLRQRAFEQHWGEPAKATFPIYLAAGQNRAFKVTQQHKLASGALIQKPVDADLAIDFIKTHDVKLWVVDPFVETHDADENDNAAMAAVAAQYRRIAQCAGCAVVLVHHTRKVQAGSSDGHAGNIDSGRGAGSVANVARIGVTLYAMSDKDAEKIGIPKESKWRWVRMDDGKANLSLSDGQPRWYEKVSTPVEALDEDGNPVTEHVGVLIPGDPRKAVGDRSVNLLRDMQHAMGAHMEMDIATIAERVMNSDPSHSSEMSVRKMIERLFEGGTVEYDQETWARKAQGSGKKALIVRVVTPPEFSSVQDL